MIDRTKPLTFPQLAGLGRDAYRLEAEYKVRLKYRDLLVIDSETKRNKFLILCWCEMNPESPLSVWVRQALYEDPQLFEKMEMPSADTILKDNRVMEAAGFFSKPEKPKAEQEKPIATSQTT